MKALPDLLDLEPEIAALDVVTSLAVDAFHDVAERPIRKGETFVIETNQQHLDRLFFLLGDAAVRAGKLRAAYQSVCRASRPAALAARRDGEPHGRAS